VLALNVPLFTSATPSVAEPSAALSVVKYWFDGVTEATSSVLPTSSLPF
jgi:hypothetical protein